MNKDYNGLIESIKNDPKAIKASTQEVEKAIEAGIKGYVIAEYFGISPSRVSQIKRAMKTRL